MDSNQRAPWQVLRLEGCKSERIFPYCFFTAFDRRLERVVFDYGRLEIIRRGGKLGRI
jgi:hypothetical protein